MSRNILLFLTPLAALLVDVGRHANAEFILGTATNLGRPINTATVDQSPSLSSDALRLYYSSGAHVGDSIKSSGDFWVATRESARHPWNAPTKLHGPINSNAFEANLAISANDLSLFFSDGIATVTGSARPDGIGQPDLWVSTRESPNDVWGAPENLGPIVNSRWYDTSPSITADGLSLFFDSQRPGGEGNADIWMTTRPTLDDGWEEPVNLGPTVNYSGIDRSPAISADGLALMYSSHRPGGFGQADIWVTTRESLESPWIEPINLGRKVNGNSGAWDLDPSLSFDGSNLFFITWQTATWPGEGEFDIWQMPLHPFETVALNGNGEFYSQNFDDALGVDSTARGTSLPLGWTGSDNGVLFETETTRRFPEGILRTSDTPIFNAGAEQDTDRALAIGATRNSEGGILQLLADVTESDANAFRLQFDIEAWDVTTSSRNKDIPGEAAFKLTVDADVGNGFTNIRDFGTVTTGPILQPPERDYLDGNVDPNRVSFDTGIQQANIPVGSKLRIRWTVPQESQSTGWVYGLDNVLLSFIGDVLGDLNGDGLCDVRDIDSLTNVVRSGSNEPAFDLNADAIVDNEDRRIWVEELKNTFYGDSNLDGEFNSTDFITVFQAGEYEDNVANNSTWATGDWNGDGEFDTGDFILAFQSGGYEQGIRPAASVPESSVFTLLFMSFLGLVARRGRLFLVKNYEDKS